MDPGGGGQLDDVTIRGAEIDRADKAMIDRPANLSAFGLALLQHIVERVRLDPECYVQIQGILLLEIKGHIGHFEKREAGAVVHLEESMEPAALVDLERADQAEAEEILVKPPRSSESRQR